MAATTTSTTTSTATSAAPAGPPAKVRKGVRLGTRIFIATALLVTFAVVSAVALTLWMGDEVGHGAARETLQRASAVQRTFQASRFEQLRLMAYLLASDPNFSAYVAEAIQAGDVPSLLDQLDERRAGLGFDFALVLDPDGLVVARTDAPEARRQDFSEEPIFRQVADEFEASGVWVQDGQLFYAVAVPITTAGLLDGYLIAAYAIDDRSALALREINNTEITFLVQLDGGPRVVAKTLSPGGAEDLLRFLKAHPDKLVWTGVDEQAEQVEIELQRQRWLAQISPLVDVAGASRGAVIHLTSLDLQLAPFRIIGRTLLGVGAVTLLLALLVSYLLPRKVLRPMNQLATAATAAAEGDYDQRIQVERADEVGQVAAAFDVLLSELRAKRDMELYVNELARTLPEPERAAPEVAAEPAAAQQLTLIGVELRDAAPPATFAPPSPQDTLDELSRVLRRIARAVESQGGAIAAVAGHRVVATFAGPQRSERALAAAAEIVSYAGAEPHPLAVALVAGMVVTGTPSWSTKPGSALTGETVEHLENLLRVARPGSLLLSASTRTELDSTFAESGVELREHRSTVSSVPLFSLTRDGARRFAVPELAATQELSTTTSVTAPHQGLQTLSGLRVGSVLAHRFEILAELGAGGMGVVYKARDRTLQELVALKMLRRELWGDAERLERLKDELRLARKITHPNVLRTFDFGEADGFPFISMEFVRGSTLREFLDRSGRLPLSAGLHTARQLCRGLIAAHAEGVLHRDIKPENLLIASNGNVKLMDFGIARPLQRSKPGQTEPGTLIGTPHYLAPEQLEGEVADERSDLYAAGVVLYEIFTGHLPFKSSTNLMEILTNKLRNPPTPPSQHWPAIPPDLERILMRCLERDRDSRYPDVATLLQELEVLRA